MISNPNEVPLTLSLMVGNERIPSHMTKESCCCKTLVDRLMKYLLIFERTRHINFIASLKLDINLIFSPHGST